MRVLDGSGDAISISLTREALLTAHCARTQRGVAVAVSLSVDASLVTWLLASFKLTDLSTLIIKVVGPEIVISKIDRLLKSASGRIEKSVVRDDAITAVFYAGEGRLRLLKVETDLASPGSSAPPELSTRIKPIRVLVIDDSPTIQKILKSILEPDAQITVVGAVTNPSEADEAVKRLQPDVITMDIHMPEMSGVDLLKILHPKYAVPTVMITSVSREESDIVLEALESGAVDYIQKPSLGELGTVAPLIIEKIKMAALSKAKTHSHPRNHAGARSPLASEGRTAAMDRNKIIAIGSSTGGTEALREIFIRLPAEIPPIVVVQHIPAIFSEALARRLNSLCAFEVKEAQDGDLLIAGRALIAPGGKHLKIAKNSDGTYRAVVYEGAVFNRHRPSVDVLFDSVSVEVGSRAVGVILTGMGTDGALGMLKMRERGARTIAQDEASSVVFGMPREAIRLGGAETVAPLHLIADKIIEALIRQKKVA